MDDPLISCLCPTWGRRSLLRECVGSFLSQTYRNKELIILNQHPVPIVCNAPGVRVYNEPDERTDFSDGLTYIRKRLYDLAEGPLVTWYEDDDLWLPWDLQQKVDGCVGDSWGPQYHLYTEGLHGNAGKIGLVSSAVNLAECSLVARRDALYDRGITDLVNNFCPWPGWVAYGKRDQDAVPSYMLRWAIPCWHLSGSGNISAQKRLGDARDLSTDTGDGSEMVPAPVSQYYRRAVNNLRQGDPWAERISAEWKRHEREAVLADVTAAGSEDHLFFGGTYTGGHKMQQVPVELADAICAIAGRVAEGGVYLEIGAAAGGTARLLGDMFGFEKTYIIDDGLHPSSHLQKALLPDAVTYRGDSRNAAKVLAGWGELFDLVLIDGCHDYEVVHSDLESVLPHVKPGGLVILHDTVAVAGPKQVLDEIRAGLFCVHEIATFVRDVNPYCGITISEKAQPK